MKLTCPRQTGRGKLENSSLAVLVGGGFSMKTSRFSDADQIVVRDQSTPIDLARR
jgi:hypothetical protein